MVADAKRLGFPFLAGSSLPVTWRLPAIDVPHGTPLIESVCAGYGGVDSATISTGSKPRSACRSAARAARLESRRCMRCAGRRSGKWSRTVRDTRRLLVSALSRSHTLPVSNGFPTGAVTFDWARKTFTEPIAYFIEHRDGFRTTLFLLAIQDFNYAGLRADNDEVIACQMYLPMPGNGSTTADFFNPLVHHIERMVLENRVPYPVERTLLTSGMTLAAVESLHRGEVRVETPEMAVSYQAPKESTFWRD